MRDLVNICTTSATKAGPLSLWIVDGRPNQGTISSRGLWLPPGFVLFWLGRLQPRLGPQPGRNVLGFLERLGLFLWRIVVVYLGWLPRLGAVLLLPYVLFGVGSLGALLDMGVSTDILIQP